MAHKRWTLAAAVTCLLASTFATAHATVMVEIPLEDLVRGADAIVHGTVVRTDGRLVMRGHSAEPHAVTTLRVIDWIHGGNGETEVTIEERGGEWQGGGMRIDGTPTYLPREEVIVFLERSEIVGGNYRTYQMVQGKFAVLRGAPGVPHSVRRDLSAVALARWVDGQMTLQPGQSEPRVELSTFVNFVRGIADRYTVPLGSGTESVGRSR